MATETTRRYISVAKWQQELALTQTQLATVRATEAAIQQRVARGVAQEADLSLAQIGVIRAELAQEHAKHELASSRFAMTSMWGESSASAEAVTGDLLELPPLPAFDDLAMRLPQTPEAKAFALQSDRLAADRIVATAAARPDLTLGLGLRRLEALNDQALVFSFSMPLGTRQRSALAVSRTDAEQLALDARQESSVLEARQQLFAHLQELGHARNEFDAITDRMLPAAEKALALTQSGYDDARYSVLQLTQAQALLLQLSQERLAAAARYHQLLAEIERSTAISGERP
jgi:cobalt-zinc-cadmium efflux system outer membrane protein